MTAVSQSFSGSDTDELDRIVEKMNDAADYAQKIAAALKVLCAALDAMSWTGYAAALARYLRAVVIPLLQTTARNLMLFAKVVGAASSVQKDASSNTIVINTGNTGYVVQALPQGSTPAAETGAPADPKVSVQKAPAIGAVPTATTPKAPTAAETTPGKAASTAAVSHEDQMKTVGGDIANLLTHIGTLQDALGAGGNSTAAIGALGAVLTDVSALLKSLDGGASDMSAAPGAAGAKGGNASGTADATAPGGKGSGAGSAGTPAGGSGATGAGAGSAGGAAASTPIDLGTPEGRQQLWDNITGVLRDGGILPPDGGDPASSAAVTGSHDLVSGDLDSIQSDLNTLRGHLGLDAPVPPAAPTYQAADTVTGAGSLAGAATFAAAIALPTGADTLLGAIGAPIGGDAASVPASFAASPSDLGGGSCGSGGGLGASGGGLGGGLPASGGLPTGGALPAGGDTGALGAVTPTAASNPVPTAVFGASAATPGSLGVDAGGTATRLVATTAAPSGSAALPLTGAAVAASLLGTVFARKTKSEASDDEADDPALTEAAAPGL